MTPVRIHVPTARRSGRCSGCGAKWSLVGPADEAIDLADRFRDLFTAEHKGHAPAKRVPKIPDSKLALRDECDDLWAQLIKMRDGGRCRRCGLGPPAVILEAAHVWGRGRYATRWEPLNGVCLCSGCHLWQTLNPHEGEKFFRALLGSPLVDDLYRTSVVRSQRTDYQAVRLGLKQALKEAQR